MGLPGVLARREGRAGVLVLDRPAALNALDVPMIRQMRAALEMWRDDPEVQLVVVEAAGDRAFCAGGDVRAVRAEAVAGRMGRVEEFFAGEYALNAAIAFYPKPYIALIDGVCMGGGIGISVHGSAQVVTERALLAMPETLIGLFPDVGTTYVLPRLPGFLGRWIALAGARLAGADAVHAGLATHFVPRAALADLRAALVADGPAVLAGFAAPLPAAGFAPHRGLIDAVFSAETVPDLLARLAASPDAFAAELLATLRAVSPSSLCWSLAMLRAGARRSLEQALAAELALTRKVCLHPDFAEGVRALLVDKDRAPRWSPASVEDVDQAAIAAMLK